MKGQSEVHSRGTLRFGELCLNLQVEPQDIIKMKGKNTFTAKEISDLKQLIRMRVNADKDDQKNIRRIMRSIGFYGSDYGIVDCQVSDLEGLIRSGMIKVVGGAATDVMSTTVTYWRPKVGSSVKRGGKAGEVSNETNPKTTPKTNLKNRKDKGSELRTKMIRIKRATPTISRQEFADLCYVNLAGIKYHLRILKDEMGIHRDGSSKTGHWVFPE